MKKALVTVFIILIGIMCIGFSYIIFMKKNNQAQLEQMKEKEFSFSMKERCQEICSKIYKNNIEESNKLQFFNPEYKYNEVLNACLYAGGQINNGIHKWVIDCFTNSEIVSYYWSDGEVIQENCPTCVSSLEDFDLKKDRLLSE